MSKSQYPDQPWIHIWTAFSLPLAWHFRPRISGKDVAMFLIYLFPLIGVFLLMGWSIRRCAASGSARRCAVNGHL